MVDVLALSPHPDDAEIGCGGSILRAVSQGLAVVLADLSEGESATRGDPESRAEEKARAAGLLGLEARLSLHLPDTRIGLEEGHRMALIELIRDLRPRIVLAPYKHDRHPDHEATARLAVEACFFAGVEAVGKGRPHRPQQLYHYMIHTDFAPSFIVDISGQWEQKMSVLNAYGSQFTLGDGPATPLSTGDFLRVQSARGRHYGAMIGVARGEPFFCAGPLPADGFPTLAAHRQSQGGAPPYRTR